MGNYENLIRNGCKPEQIWKALDEVSGGAQENLLAETVNSLDKDEFKELKEMM